MSSLYSCVVRRIVCDDSLLAMTSRQRQLTPAMRFDIYWELFSSDKENSLEFLEDVLKDIDVFAELLKLGYRREKLHIIFEAVNEISQSDERSTLAQIVADAFKRRVCVNEAGSATVLHSLGHNLASFLIDGAWYVAAETVLVSLRQVNNRIMLETQVPEHYKVCLTKDLELMTSLLHVFSEYRNYAQADLLFATINADNKLSCLEDGVNPAALYGELCNYCFGKSLYREAYEFGIKAVKSLKSELPSRVIIDVLRHAGKASVVRRQFVQAETLLQEALLHARDVYGECHLKYADCLVDMGFYLLNVDGVAKSVQAYEKALSVREAILGKANLMVAKAHEELAYATYVHEYNTGHFLKAKRHAETALLLLQRIVPSNHLLLASSQRVLALILEEIALDLNDKPASPDMLHQAERLHISAVNLTKATFGEINVQTAKHYGNLGRLYQTMGKFEKAEEMHLKAIEIKEALLGREDYEVALSIGHLASLYNYDLREFDKAKELYLRSIAIALRLFGPSYSGLEYDYRGLIRVYEETLDWDNAYHYIYKLRDWKALRRARENYTAQEVSFVANNQTVKPLNKIVQLMNVWNDQISTEELLVSSNNALMKFNVSV